MNKSWLIPILLLAGAFLAGWYFATQYMRLETEQQSTRKAVDNHEDRLRLLEQDYQRRKNLRDKVETAWQVLRNKIGF